MSNNKQSSVGLLITILGNYDEELLFLFREQIKQAKAMHKQEIIDSANKLLYHGTGPGDTAAEQYYNETYKSE